MHVYLFAKYVASNHTHKQAPYNLHVQECSHSVDKPVILRAHMYTDVHLISIAVCSVCANDFSDAKEHLYADKCSSN